jgi:hypothetical protein
LFRAASVTTHVSIRSAGWMFPTKVSGAQAGISAGQAKLSLQPTIWASHSPGQKAASLTAYSRLGP